MKLLTLVTASRRVAETSRRLEKIGILADLLRQLEPAEIPIAVAYLSGNLRQGRIGIGWALLREASPVEPAAEAVLTLQDVDDLFSRIADGRPEGGRAQGLARPFRDGHLLPLCDPLDLAALTLFEKDLQALAHGVSLCSVRHRQGCPLSFALTGTKGESTLSAASPPPHSSREASVRMVHWPPGAWPAPGPEFLESTHYLDSANPEVRAFAQRIAAGESSEVARAVRLFYAVRDGWRYDPFSIRLDREQYIASHILRARAVFCIPKGILLAAAARTMGIPAGIGLSDVVNHLTTEKLRARMGGETTFIHHRYAIL